MPITPVAFSLAMSSDCVPAPLVELQAWQSSWRLSGWFVPPRERGTIWSIAL